MDIAGEDRVHHLVAPLLGAAFQQSYFSNTSLPEHSVGTHGLGVCPAVEHDRLARLHRVGRKIVASSGQGVDGEDVWGAQIDKDQAVAAVMDLASQFSSGDALWPHPGQSAH